jgi:hypothetical protein
MDAGASAGADEVADWEDVVGEMEERSSVLVGVGMSASECVTFAALVGGLLGLAFAFTLGLGLWLGEVGATDEADETVEAGTDD